MIDHQENENLFVEQWNTAGTSQQNQPINSTSNAAKSQVQSSIATESQTFNDSADVAILDEHNSQNLSPQQNGSISFDKKGKVQYLPGQSLFNSNKNKERTAKRKTPAKFITEDDEIVQSEVTPQMQKMMENRMESVQKPGIIRRTLHSLCGTGGTASDDEKISEGSDIIQPETKKKKTNSPDEKIRRGPYSSTKRSQKAAAANQAKKDKKIVESMSEDQRGCYDNLKEKYDLLKDESSEHKKNIAVLNKKVTSLEASQNPTEKDLEAENVKLREQFEELQRAYNNQNKKMMQQENEITSLREQLSEAESSELLVENLQKSLLQASQQLTTTNQTVEILNTGQRKLREVLAKTAADNRKLEAQTAEIENQKFMLEKNLEEVKGTLDAMGNLVKSALMQPPKIVQKSVPAPAPLTPFNDLGERAQRQYVHDLVEMLESQPLMKQKIMKRLVPKKAEESHKMTPNQAVALAVTIGLSQSKIEKLKSFLRLINLDILPPMASMRKLIKDFHNEYKYETFEDKEKGIYCRRAVSVSDLIKLRVKRLMESKNFEDIPGFEDYVIIGITADKGGGSIKVALSLCNVKNGKASPNDLTIIDDYDTVKYCFGKSFDEINELDEKYIEVEVDGKIIQKKVLFVVCCDGKMMSCLSGHSGASSTNPCFCCEATKEEINERKTAPLRNAETMKEQALKFKNEGCSRAECKSITNPPICTIPYDRWIYGALHSVGGPAVAVLKKVEETALEADLVELGVTIPNKKEAKKKAIEVQQKINQIKHDMDEAKRALKLSKQLLPKWKKQSKRPSEESEDCCGGRYCIKGLINDNSLFSSCVTCESCRQLIHASCDLLVLSYEIESAQNEGYLCSNCSEDSDADFIDDLKERQNEWSESLNLLKETLLQNEQSEENIAIPYDKCVRYQKIQTKLKELNVRKTKGFQTLNGIDVRRLVKNGDQFAEAVVDEQKEAVKDFFSCLNKFQEFAKPKLLTDEEIESLDAEKLLDSYQQICGGKVTPKLHDLTEHTPQFMAKFHFYQYCSDQPIENCHALSNFLLRSQTNSKRQDHTQLEAITNNFCLRNMLFDIGLNIGNLQRKSFAEKQAMFDILKS